MVAGRRASPTLIGWVPTAACAWQRAPFPPTASDNEINVYVDLNARISRLQKRLDKGVQLSLSSAHEKLRSPLIAQRLTVSISRSPRFRFTDTFPSNRIKNRFALRLSDKIMLKLQKKKEKKNRRCEKNERRMKKRMRSGFFSNAKVSPLCSH